MYKLLPLIILSLPTILILIAVIRYAKRKNQVAYRSGRLSKSDENRIVAGVCGGIAKHFGWSATIVRLFFLFSGIGLFTYIVLAVVIPDSDSRLV
jgi:phage shock protein C